MNLCSHNHDEVCYNDHSKCPVCEKQQELNEARSLLAGAEQSVKSWKNEHNLLEKELNEAKAYILTLQGTSGFITRDAQEKLRLERNEWRKVAEDYAEFIELFVEPRSHENPQILKLAKDIDQQICALKAKEAGK